MLGFPWRADQAPIPTARLIPESTTMYYHLLPVETMAGAIQFVCYLLTLLSAALTYLLVRH